MLYKNFINKNEHIILKEWIKNKELEKYESYGKINVFHLTDEDYNKEFLKLILHKISLNVNNSSLDKKDCFLLNIEINGVGDKHRDKQTRFIILINKPSKSGCLKILNKEILMEETDGLLFDATIYHEITKVLGNKKYTVLVFSFNK